MTDVDEEKPVLDDNRKSCMFERGADCIDIIVVMGQRRIRVWLTTPEGRTVAAVGGRMGV